MPSDSDSDWDAEPDDYSAGWPDEETGDEETGTVPCPVCGSDVYEFADQCPVCGEFIVPAASTSPLRDKPGVWVFLGIAGILAVILYLLGAGSWF